MNNTINNTKKKIKGGHFFGFFKPDGTLPLSFAHVGLFGFTLAILLFLYENITIILFRSLTDTFISFFKIEIINNINHWVNFRFFNLFLIFYLLIYKFKVGYINSKAYYTILIVLIILFTKGILKNVITYLTGIKFAISDFLFLLIVYNCL
jgi:hypothetical protein